MPTMKTSPDWLKAGITAKANSVDRANNVLRGYVIAQEGPFKSEGRGEFDKQALEMLVKLGNAKGGGLKSRFTHPNMSSDGLGKFLGRAKNLRMDKAIDARTGKTVNAVRGDLYFDKTALEPPPEGNGNKPLGIYVMDLAESDSDMISSSIVVKADEEYRRKKDGTLELDAHGEPLPPLWRPTELHASDIVDTGDAVDGLLSAQIDVEHLPLSVLWKGEQLLDAVFLDQTRDVIEARLTAYVQRYLDRKFGKSPSPSETPVLAKKREQMEAMNVAMRELKK